MKKAILILLSIAIWLPSWSQSEKELQEKIAADESAKMLKSAPGDEGLSVERGTGVNAEGFALFGNPNGSHIAIDTDDIQRKTGTGASYGTLYHNFYGGAVNIASGIDGGNYNTTLGGSSTNEGALLAYGALYAGGADDRVGIGTTSPSTKLHVSVTGSELARFESSTSSKWISMYEGGVRKGILWNAGNDMVLRADEVGSAVRIQTDGFNDRLIANSTGIGIGVAPTADITLEQSELTIGGTGGMEFNNNGDGWKIYFSGSHFSFIDRVTGDNDRRAYVEDNTGNYVQPSDLNKKANIALLAPVLAKVNQLKPCTYNYIGNNTKTYGFIAQEVATIIPDLVRYDENNEPGLAYDHFGVVAIKAIQEQQVTIENQQKEINQMKKEMAAIKALLVKVVAE